MKKQPLLVAFSTQKGGVGKSVLTTLIASYLYYVKGYSLAVVDCDYPQHSIYNMRLREIDAIKKDDYYKRQAHYLYTSINKKAYPIIESTPEMAISDADELVKKHDTEFDIILFDLPGTVNSSGVIYTIASLDYIFIPISADRIIMQSTLGFTSLINDNLITTGKGVIKGVYLIWNLVDGREKNALYEIYEEVINKLGLSVLKTRLPNSRRFCREPEIGHKITFRSTLFPPDKKSIKGSNIDHLADEICSIIKL